MTPVNKGNFKECEYCEYKTDEDVKYPCLKSHTDVREAMTGLGCGLLQLAEDEATDHDEDIENLSYRFYLFSKLYDEVLAHDAELEYDILFPKVVQHYRDYLESQYNDHNMSEYECIMDFLENWSKDGQE